MTFWILILIIAVVAAIAWGVEQRLARKDAEEQAHLRAVAAAAARARISADHHRKVTRRTH